MTSAAIAIPAIVELTVRGLLSRRRSLIMLLLASLPVLLALLIRLAGRGSNPVAIAATVLDDLVLRTVLPLVALVFGTAALGSELEDGSAVFLLAKPVPRWQIVAAKLIGAAGLTIALIVPTAVAAGLLVSGDQGGGFEMTIAAAIAWSIAIVLYCALFLALSIWTSRALIIGLVYTLIWEGVLAGLFEGTRLLSVRQYALSIADALDPGTRLSGDLDLVAAVAMAVIVFAAAAVLATQWLVAYQVRAPE
jgi:ABC-2 type transport system permease protein